MRFSSSDIICLADCIVKLFLDLGMRPETSSMSISEKSRPTGRLASHTCVITIAWLVWFHYVYCKPGSPWPKCKYKGYSSIKFAYLSTFLQKNLPTFRASAVDFQKRFCCAAFGSWDGSPFFIALEHTWSRVEIARKFGALFINLQINIPQKHAKAPFWTK